MGKYRLNFFHEKLFCGYFGANKFKRDNLFHDTCTVKDFD